MNTKQEFKSGDKVVYLMDGKTYDFGYYSRIDGSCVIYKEGERNMQDAYAIKTKNIRRTFK